MGYVTHNLVYPGSLIGARFHIQIRNPNSNAKV